MTTIPRLPSLDSTWALVRDPYRFISSNCDRLGTDIFETRIVLRSTLCLRGKEMAEIFYNPAHFTRRGAAPGRIQKTLFGKGGVQSLDGEEHRCRKQMFLSLMTPDRIQAFTVTARDHWTRAIREWEKSGSLMIYTELQHLFSRIVCQWAGVPLRQEDARLRTGQLVALFDSAGDVGPKHWKARWARREAEQWMAGMIQDIRSDSLRPRHDTAAWVIAHHRDESGDLLSPKVAAVELLNILRPTVAVSVYGTFIALALEDYSGWRERLRDPVEEDLESFVQEVRRFYPFFPMLPAIVRSDFEGRGYRFPEGQRVLLDLYGTNHHPRWWDDPSRFHPERFASAGPRPYSFVPQGGGDHLTNHRCPGEWIAIELMKITALMLAGKATYSVPKQDLSVDFSRLPALPRSGFRIERIKSQRAFRKAVMQPPVPRNGAAKVGKV